MPKPAGIDPTSIALMDRLVQVSFAVIAVLSRVAAAHDMSLTQLRVLAILRDRQPKMAELAAHLGLERSSVSGLVDRAVARGLLRRDNSTDDARAVHVSITPDGRRLATRVTREVAEGIAPLTQSLTAADARRLVALADKILLAGAGTFPP